MTASCHFIFRLCLCTLLALACHCPLKAQEAGKPAPRWWQLADRVWQTLPDESGALSNAVITMMEDAQGFLWIGTQYGLMRWDGYRLRTYLHDAQDATSLPDSYIQALHLDQQGRMWVGTLSGGLAWYDAQRDRFVTIPVGPKGLPHAHVFAMADDGEREPGLWVITREGLDHLHIASGKVTPLRHIKDNPATPPDNQVFRVFHDKQGRLWLSTGHGLMWRERGSTQFRSQALPIAKNANPQISSMMQASDGRIWIGTFEQGLFVLDPANGKVETILDSSTGTTLDHDTVSALVEVAPGQFWIGTDAHGVIILDLSSMQTHRITHDPALSTSLPDNEVTRMLRDRSGLIWLASPRGISRHHPNNDAIHTLFGNNSAANHIADSNVNTVRAMPDGSIWLGVLKKGVSIIDAAQPLIRALPHVGPDWPPAAVQTISVPINNQVLIATPATLYTTGSNGAHLDFGNATRPRPGPTAAAGSPALSRIIRSNHEPNEWPVNDILQDGKEVFLGTSIGPWLWSGVNHERPEPLPGAGMEKETVTAIEKGSQDILWIGTNNGGLFRYQRKTKQIQQMVATPGQADALASNSIATLLQDSRGWLWIGTIGNGISILKSQQAGSRPSFVNLTTRQGLPHGVVNKLLEDNQGRIWASTDAGIALINPKTLAIEVMRRADGAHLLAYWSNSGDKTANGDLLFGGAGGLAIIHPERYQSWVYQPPLVITHLQVGNQEQVSSRFNLPGSEQQTLLIEPDANSLSVEFAALDFSAPEQNRYAWRLDGVDKDWINNDASKRQANYANLPPGQYQLRLRGSNRNGIWSPQEKVILVQVRAAWYQTWWFRLACVLLGSLAIHALVQARTRYLRQRQHELESQVRQRTLQLQEAQAQLVQQEKLASLGGVVTGIAHEINTPLGTTLVALSGIADIWKHLKDAMAQGNLSKAMLDSATHDGEEYTTLALGSANRAADLVTIFKSIAVPLEQQHAAVMHLNQYLPEIAALIHSQLEQNGCELVIEVDPDLTIAVAHEALTAALTRILANVPDHAFYHGRKGVLHISAHVERDDNGAAQSLLIDIKDDGHGIAPADLARVFDPFFTTKSGSHGHIGLGLHVAFNHVTQGLQGTISLASVVGQGTTVSIRLPGSVVVQ